MAEDWRPPSGAAGATRRRYAVGRAALAMRIIEEARVYGVPVREDEDLAAVLARVELGERIPLEAVVAVAELIAWVWRTGDRRCRR